MAIEPVRHDLAGVRRFRSAPLFPSLSLPSSLGGCLARAVWRGTTCLAARRNGYGPRASASAESGTDRHRAPFLEPPRAAETGTPEPPDKGQAYAETGTARADLQPIGNPGTSHGRRNGYGVRLFFGDAETGTVICARPRPVSAEPFAAETGTRIGRGNTGLAAQKWVRPSGGRPAASSGRGSVVRRNGYARRCTPSSQRVYVCEHPLLI